MSNFDSSLRECFGFSHIIISESLSVCIALELISPRLPIGVEIMYKPFCIKVLILFFILLQSCAPANNIFQEKLNKKDPIIQNETKIKSNTKEQKIKLSEKKLNKIKLFTYPNEKFQKNITIILSKKDNPETVSQFINIVELAVYQKKIKNITFSINLYEDNDQLNDFLTNQDLAGKIFIGPLNSTDTKLLEKFSIIFVFIINPTHSIHQLEKIKISVFFTHLIIQFYCFIFYSI